MAYVARELAAPAPAAWAVLIDPTTYPEWLIGAQEIRDIDDDWPAVGSRFHHRVGIGPLTLPDNSEVVAVVGGSRLVLRVKARPFIAAVVTFHIVGDGARCVVTMQEEPALRTIGNVVRPLMDPLIHVRNHRSLRRLAALIEGVSPLR